MFGERRTEKMVNRKVKKTALCVFLSLLIASTIGVTASAKPNEVGLAFSDGTAESTVQESSAEDGAEAESTESKADDGAEAESTESKVEDSNSGENDGASEVVVTEQVSEVSSVPALNNEPEINADGTTNVYYRVFLGGNFAKTCTNLTEGFLDYSNVKITVLTADKKRELDKYSITNHMLNGELSNMELPVRSVKVDKWEQGSSFVVRFENLPSIYQTDVQEITVNYEELRYENPLAKQDKTVLGINETTAIKVQPELKDFNVMLYLCTSDGHVGANAVLKINGMDVDGQVIYTKVETTNQDGLALLKVTDNNIVSLGVSSESVVNGEVISGVTEFAFNTGMTTPKKYVVYTDASYSEGVLDILEEDEIKVVPSTLIVNGVFKDRYDMSLFRHTDVGVAFFKDREVAYSFLLNKESNRGSTVVGNGKYTIKSTGDDYVMLSDSTISVTGSATVDVIFEPQLSLKIVNEINGVSQTAHFSVNAKDYSDKSYLFSVNRGAVYGIRNLDTGKVYDVHIGGYKETVLNIADGGIKQTGILSGETTSTSANNPEDNDILPPKTGDVFGIVLGSMLGITGIASVGYIYYKRKGQKYNEKEQK